MSTEVERTVGVAVVGAGVVSDLHMSALEENPKAELVAVCDTDETRADEAAAEYGTDPVYDVEALLESDIDLIHVCTSVQSHFPIAKRIIEAGIDVLIEKPVTETVEEAEELVALSAENDVSASVVHQHLFGSALFEARRTIRAGEIGQVRAVDLRYLGQPPPDEANRGTWVEDLPGGEFEEGLPHPIYMTLAIGGYPKSVDDVEAITSLLGSYDGDFAYDNAQVQYVSENGALCTVQMTSNGNPQRMMHVHGEDGALLIDEGTQSLVSLPRNYATSPVSKARKNLDISVGFLRELVQKGKFVAESTVLGNKRMRGYCHYHQIDRTLEANAEGTEPPIPIEEGVWTIRLMQAIRDASTERTARVEHPP